MEDIYKFDYHVGLQGEEEEPRNYLSRFLDLQAMPAFKKGQLSVLKEAVRELSSKNPSELTLRELDQIRRLNDLERQS